MKQRDIIILLIPSFILILAWIIFSIYHNSVASTITPVVNIQISPITPVFDVNAISNLKQRQKVTPIYEAQVPATPTPAPGFPNIFSSSLSASQINSSNNTPQGSPGGSLSP
jgi:hypothetical protein